MNEDPRLVAALESLEEHVLGSPPHLTRGQVAERAGVPLQVAMELWQRMGFPHTTDDDVAFTDADVRALALAHELMALGILSEERQFALVRTLGRSYARLADWQSALLTDLALEGGGEPDELVSSMSRDILPRIEELQNYVWRRHLVSAGSRALAVASPGSAVSELAVGFVDIVGYTSRSKELSEAELVGWLEHFEDTTLQLVVVHGGRIIKNIGDEVLFVTDDPHHAVQAALTMARQGEDPKDPFPRVRAGVAYGEVVSRLGDVFGPTVNVAARLTTAARPGTVLVDRGAHAALTGDGDEGEDAGEDPRRDQPSAYRFRRVRRLSVKGYSRLRAWVVREADGPPR